MSSTAQVTRAGFLEISRMLLREILHQLISRWWYLNYFQFSSLGKIPILTGIIFQMGWFNHQLDMENLAGLPPLGSPKENHLYPDALLGSWMGPHPHKQTILETSLKKKQYFLPTRTTILFPQNCRMIFVQQVSCLLKKVMSSKPQGSP